MDDKALQDAIEEILWDEFGPWRMDDGGPAIVSVAQKIAAAIKACDCPCHDVIQPGLIPCPRCEA